jgi:hypothetical protein
MKKKMIMQAARNCIVGGTDEFFLKLYDCSHLFLFMSYNMCLLERAMLVGCVSGLWLVCEQASLHSGFRQIRVLQPNPSCDLFACLATQNYTMATGANVRQKYNGLIRLLWSTQSQTRLDEQSDKLILHNIVVHVPLY